MSRSQASADAHPTHDQVLLAAFVAGDLDGPAADRARHLVSTCDECAALAADLMAMTSAIRGLPSPVRSRDFRITAEQAAAAERRGIRRFLPGAGQSLGFARPLGGSLAALGVAGLLLTSLFGAQPAMILSTVGSAVGGAGPAAGYGAPLAPVPAGTNGADTGSKGEGAAPSAAASAAAVASAAASAAGQPSAAASAAPSAAVSDGAARDLASTPAVPPPGQPSSPPTAPVLLPTSPAPSTAGTPAPGTSVPGSASPGGVPFLPAASIAALLAGLGLLGADVVARRR